MLLHWGILESTNSLAAVRFSQPVQVHEVRIFPTGARPFKLQPEIVAKTEPSSMYLDVYFNAQPLLTGEKQKRGPANALVPTSIAYAGDQAEFPVDMGPDYSTRLMIIRGIFSSLSIAVYGEVVQETTTSDVVYEAKQLPTVPFHTLPPNLDPSHSLDPSALAQELLSMIPDSPSLQLITRLMFCLKPSNEDWDKPAFPHLYSDLDDIPEYFDLDRAVELTARPVADTVDEEILRKFAIRVSETVDLYNDDQAYLFAKLLSQCAPQHPSLTQFILEQVDMARMYCLKNMDRPTLLYLLDASANLDVSRQLSNPEIVSSIEQLQNSHHYDEDTKRAAGRLYKRVKGWEAFEESLSNESAYHYSVSLLKDASVDEVSFGIFLESMLSHREVLDRMLENDPPAQHFANPPRLWNSTESLPYDEFVAFVRTFVGVASVVAVYAWADSVPVDDCRERALAVLRLWQTIDGYREIVNHLLLMRQMIYRLECMLPMEDDLPTRSGLNAEHILQQLATQPESMLRADFVKVMQNLRSPLNYITDEEVDLFHQLSSIAKNGLHGAFRVFSTEPGQLEYSSNNITLRIAAAILSDALRNEGAGEKAILQAGWENGHNNLTVYIVAHLERIDFELREQFILDPPPSKSRQGVAELFLTAGDLTDLIRQLLPIYPIFGRYLVTLTRSITGIYVYSDSLDMSYVQESLFHASATSARVSCADLAFAISRESETSKSYAATLLKTILDYGSVPGNHDAVHHVAQVISLFDYVLPNQNSFSTEEDRTTWVKKVLPPVMNSLRSFFRLQGNDAKVYLVQRFLELDEGILGVAEWLLLEELHLLKSLVDSLDVSLVDPLQQMIQHYSITMSIKILLSLSRSPRSSSWIFTQCTQSNDISESLTENLSKFLLRNLHHEHLSQLAIELSTHCKTAPPELRRAVLTTLIRATYCGNWKAIVISPELVLETESPLLDVSFSQELGGSLEAIAQALRDKASVEIDVADGVLELLNRLLSPTLRKKWVILGVTEDSLQRVLEWAASSASVCLDVDVDALKAKMIVNGDPKNPPTSLPTTEVLELPMEDWISLISPPPEPPSTPKRKSPAETAEMIGLIAVSPPNALLRSPEVKGLTKIYQNNDFRQLRQSSSARQNTSRLPSTHVDDFQHGSSPIAPLNLGLTSPSFAPIPTRPPTSLEPSLPINPNLPMNPYTAFQQ